MFYYYGRKKRLAGLYPTPAHDLIIEPFAGSAAYALHGDNWQGEVWINDLDPDIYKLWIYLQQASQFDIHALPDIKPGQKVRELEGLTPEERHLIRLHMNPGTLGREQATERHHWREGQNYIARSLDKIRHWKITNLDYADLPDLEATWFVDPPYQHGGEVYPTTITDYEKLGGWCRTRPGQVIVCEQRPADWLPFRRIRRVLNMSSKMSSELVWTQSGSQSAGNPVSS